MSIVIPVSQTICGAQLHSVNRYLTPATARPRHVLRPVQHEAPVPTDIGGRRRRAAQQFHRCHVPAQGAEYDVLLENGTMVVCVDADEPATVVTHRYVVLTYVGLDVSQVLLIVHLSVFDVLPEINCSVVISLILSSFFKQFINCHIVGCEDVKIIFNIIYNFL